MSDEDTSDDRKRLRSRVDTALVDALEAEYEEVCAQCGGHAETLVDEVTTLHTRLRLSLLRLESEEALRRGVALAYAEIKSRWTLLTTEIRDRAQFAGTVPESLVCRAACMSLVVQHLAPVVSREEVERVCAFLAEPIE